MGNVWFAFGLKLIRIWWCESAFFQPYICVCVFVCASLEEILTKVVMSFLVCDIELA